MISSRLKLSCLIALSTGALLLPRGAQAQVWSGYAGNAQHTALSTVASQSLQQIVWSTPVDLNPQYSGTTLYAHYGSPLITNSNTVIIPVKTGANDGFKVEARNGANGALMWTSSTDYSLPSHGWVPSYAPTLTSTGRMYMAGGGGTVLYQSNLDSNAPTAATRVSIVGDAHYAANKAAFDSGLKICTPLTSDSQGNVYFGYRVSALLTLEGGATLSSGIAKVSSSGQVTLMSASAATGGNATEIAMNAALAISNDGKKVYAVMRNTDTLPAGYLVSMDTTTLAPNATVRLKDAQNPLNDAWISDDGTASPTIGPDGKVYIGVLERPFASSRGWMLQFNGDLTPSGAAGAFGWDDTATVIPASSVKSYTGTSSYLLMTKYNDYGPGNNRLAIVDPNDTFLDTRTNTIVMKEILTIAGLTPDPDLPRVREWCINTAAFDPFSNSVLANSEDGKLYRWSLDSNTFTEVITLTVGIGEAYTPTLIGADGKVYAINNATLYAVGALSGTSAPEPGTLALAVLGLAVLRRRKR
jgi:uncharacterized protein (TIGR03382 family)